MQNNNNTTPPQQNYEYWNFTKNVLFFSLLSPYMKYTYREMFKTTSNSNSSWCTQFPCPPANKDEHYDMHWNSHTRN